MATKYEEGYDSASTDISRGASLLKTIVGLSPVAAGVWEAQRRLKANEAIRSPMMGSTPNQVLGKNIGANARRVQRSRNDRAAAAVEELKKGLANSSELNSVVSKLEEHNALLHTLSITLDDPSMGLDATAVQSLKSQIDSAMANASADDVKTLSDKVVKTLLDTGSPESILKFNENLGEFRGLSAQLEVPDFSIPKSGQSMNPISLGSLRGKGKGFERAASRLARLEESLPQGMSVQVFHHREMGHDFVQANLLFNGRYQATVPLKLGGGTYFRSGESGNTLYGAPRKSVNISGFERFASANDMSSMDIGKLQKKGVVRDYEDMALDEALKSFKSDDIGMRNYRQAIEEPLIAVDRIASQDSVLGRHVRAQIETQTNVVYGHGFSGLSSNRAINAVSTLARVPGLDAGAAGPKRLITGHGAGKRAMIGMVRGGTMGFLQDTYGSAVNRTTLPITARESQTLGRPSMFVDPVQKIGAGYIGGVGYHGVGSNVGWSGGVTGGMNKFVVMDFSAEGTISKALSGQGLAYTASTHKVVKPGGYGILNPLAAGNALDPQGHSLASSSLLNEVMNKGSVTLSAEQLRSGQYVGQTSSGAKMASSDPRATSKTVRFDRAGRSYGKQMIYLSEETTREMSYVKGFGLTVKSNIDTVGQKRIDLMHKADPRLADLERDLEKVGISGYRSHAIYSSSEMLKKGSALFTHQIASSAAMLGLPTAELRELAESGSSRFGKAAHGRWAEAAFKELARRGVGGGALGSMLAGVYHGAEGKGVKGHGLNQDVLEQMVRSSGLGNTDQEDAIRAMKRGVVGYIETITAGPSAGDWGQGRAGAEMRFGKTALEALRASGIDTDKSASIVSNIYKSKVGLGSHFSMAEQLTGMVKSITGQSGALDAIDQRDVPNIKWGDLKEAIGTGSNNMDLVSFLRNQEQGINIDFSDAPAHFRRALQEVGGTSSVFLPGSPAFSAEPGTTIKQAGGADASVEAAYGQTVKGLESIMDRYGKSGDGLRESLSTWRDGVLDMYSRVLSGLGAGKLSGSSSPRIRTVDITSDTSYARPQMRRMTEIVKRTKATAIFGDTTFFLSELFNRTKSGANKTSVREAEMFFTGMGGDVDPSSGLMRMAGRDPTMSSGNAFIAQVFRNPTEVSSLGGVDEFFANVKASGLTVGGKHLTGAKLMEEFFQKDIASFEDMASNNKGRRRFFESLINNLSSFTSGQGGGVMTVPRIMTSEGDVGLAPSAFADADGDTLKVVSFSPEDSKSVRSAVASMTAADVGAELQYRTMMDKFGSGIKKGLVSYGEAQGVDLSVSEMEQENILKELGTSQQTGALDTRLRPLHEALENYGDGSHTQRAYRNFLGALEEHTILKAKHMKRFSPVADMVGRAAESLANRPSADTREALFDVLSNVVFHNQSGEFTTGEISAIPGSRGESSLGKFLENTTKGSSTSVSVRGIVDELYRVSTIASSEKTNVHTTQGRLSRSFSEDPARAILNLETSRYTEAAALMEFSADSMPKAVAPLSSAIDKAGDFFSKLDRRIAAPLAVGAGAAMLALGAIGAPAYSSTPLTGAGEVVGAGLQQQIAQGNLFRSPDPSVAPEALQPRPAPDYGMLNRPINVGSTHLERPSSYSIRGELQDPSGLQSAVGYINRLTGGAGGAAGSIRLNDTRRPITRSYVDRLMGEY